MTNALILMGMITLIVSVVALLDWLARRKDRQSHTPRA